jgi:hypothetical protein
MIELFDHYYIPYENIGDGESNARALESAWHDTAIAQPFLFTIYLGLGIETMESIVWLTPTIFLNNPDIPFD